MEEIGLFCMTLTAPPACPLPLGKGKTRTRGWRLWRGKTHLGIRQNFLVAELSEDGIGRFVR